VEKENREIVTDRWEEERTTSESLTDLWVRQPLVFALQVDHVAVKVVEEFVLKHGVVHQVPLASGVVVALLVAVARKVQPLWVTKLIPCTDNVQFEGRIIEGLLRVLHLPLSSHSPTWRKLA
jgi:hypothetical protein